MKNKDRAWHFMPLSEIGVLPVVVDSPPRFIHVVNPFTGGKASGIDQTQKTTIEGMAEAKASSSADVLLLFALEQGDGELSFNCGESVECINRYVSDVAEFESKKKLPMLYDIIGAALEHAKDDDYIVYTNVDIIPVPHFYDALDEIARRGLDAFSINRRTLSGNWDSIGASALRLSEVGTAHPGTDCLVFKAKIFRQCVESKTCIGAMHVMKSFLYSLAALSSRLVIIEDAYLTCHIGDDRAWGASDFNEYAAHNKREAFSVVDAYCQQGEEFREKLLRFARARKDGVLLDYLNPPSFAQRMARYLKRWVKSVLQILPSGN